MQNLTVVRFFSLKTLIVTAVTILGLGVSIANAGPAAKQPPSGNDLNYMAGGGNS
jgi:hypothetical protein